MSRHLDQGDMDRWLPLCLAVRQCKRDLAEDMGSKKRDHAGVVRNPDPPTSRGEPNGTFQAWRGRRNDTPDAGSAVRH